MIRSKNRKQVDLANKKTRGVFITVGTLFLILGIVLISLGIAQMANEDYFGFSPLIIIGVFFSFFGLSFLIMVVMAAIVLASSKKNVTKQTAEAPYQDYSFDRKQDYSFEHKEVGGVECNYCHHMNQPGSIYCSKCGEKIRTKTICPNCKAENDGSSSYCYRCGHRL